MMQYEVKAPVSDIIGKQVKYLYGLAAVNGESLPAGVILQKPLDDDYEAARI